MGCRKRAPRDELVRIVRDRDGTIRWDEEGTAPGRGAYVCSTMECVDRSVAAGLSRALRTDVDQATMDRLKREFAAPMNDCGARSAEQAK